MSEYTLTGRCNERVDESLTYLCCFRFRYTCIGGGGGGAGKTDDASPDDKLVLW